MWMYHFSEARRSLLKNRKLSALIVATITIGIALLMTMQTTVYQQSRIPVKHLAPELYVIAADNREADAQPLRGPDVMPALSWADAMHFYQAATPATQQSINYSLGFITKREDREARPAFADGSATDRHFFSLFDIPFLYGAPWNSDADEGGDAVVVLSQELNEQMFGGQNSVGQTITVNDGRATIVGVLGSWAVNQRFYDRTFSGRDKHHVFVPIKFAVDRNLMRMGRISCSRTQREAIGYVRSGDVNQLVNSDCGWINLWARISSPDEALQYEQLLQQYIADERKRGRYPRETDTLVMDLKTLTGFAGQDVWADTLLILAWLFFLVCMINTVGVLLAKFLTHSKRVSLYRALGATRSQILKQHLLEVAILGFTGAVLGLLLSWFGLQLMFQVEMYQMDYDADPLVVKKFFTLDWKLIAMAIGISLVSVTTAGLYPIWKICNISPASQLKS